MAAVVSIFLLASVSPARAGCGSTTFTPIGPGIPPGTVHNAYYLVDPSGHQRAVFDLEWGGALASLQLDGVEFVYGNAPGAMVQPAFHAGSPDYNPTLAGANPAKGSPVTGVRCISANQLDLQTTLLDYNNGANPAAPFLAVRNGVVQSGTYSTPYVTLSEASFVYNPAGYPAYYLKIHQTLTNTHPTEAWPWGFEVAGYVPAEYDTFMQYPSGCDSHAANCLVSQTPKILSGLYTDSTLTNGVAFFVDSQSSWNPSTDTWAEFVEGGGIYEGLLNATHIWDAYWGLPPGSSRTLTFYVMLGSWGSAMQFIITSSK